MQFGGSFLSFVSSRPAIQIQPAPAVNVVNPNAIDRMNLPDGATLGRLALDHFATTEHARVMTCIVEDLTGQANYNGLPFSGCFKTRPFSNPGTSASTPSFWPS